MKKLVKTKPEFEALEKPKRKEVFIKELSKLEKQHGVIIPQDVVDRARPASSPIHDLFDWDDKSAGEKFRVWQARSYITTVKIEIMGKETEAFYNTTVMIDKVPVRGYYSAQRVLNDENMSKAILSQAIRELNYWENKYKHLKELTGIIDFSRLANIKKQLK